MFLYIGCVAQAQDSAKNKNPFPVKYSSIADEKILLKTITLAPVYDNLGGVYSQPIQKLLIDLLQTDKSWGYATYVDDNKTKFIENYDTNPNDVLETLIKSQAQGLMTAFITKGPRGLNAKLKLFTHDQGLILIEESIDDLNAFEISKLREYFVSMYQALKNKLPYRGYVLSRRGTEVTVSLGAVNGVKVGQELTIAQIIKLNRHPKLKTLVGVEKEIIARIQVYKVDAYLSFAKIVFEKETGVLTLGSKVLPEPNLNYPTPKLNAEGSVVSDTYANETAKQPTSSKPVENFNTESEEVYREREQLFDRHNSTGSVTVQGVISQITDTHNLQSGATASSSQGFAPGLYLGTQIYILKNLFGTVGMQMNSSSVSNGLAGSTPQNMSYSYTTLSGAIGYDYNFEDDTDGIKFTGALGFNNYKTSVDDTLPVSLTSTETTAIALMLKASMSLAPDYPLNVGGQIDFSLSPSFSESPVSSGSASASITSLGFFAVYPINDKFNFKADLTILNIGAKFSGAATRPNPAGSTSLQTMSERFGIEYLF